MAPLFVYHDGVSHSFVAHSISRKWKIDKGAYFALGLHIHCVAFAALSGENGRGKGQEEVEIKERRYR